MMFDFLHQLSAKHRTRRANRPLGSVPAFVAGVINAGGFLALHRHSSHMTGIVSLPALVAPTIIIDIRPARAAA